MELMPQIALKVKGQVGTRKIGQKIICLHSQVGRLGLGGFDLLVCGVPADNCCFL